MYMTLEYETDNPANVPVGLRVRAVGPDGPLYAAVAWDRGEMSEDVSGPVKTVQGFVSFNGVFGVAAYAMQGAELLSLEASAGGPVVVRSARFSQKAAPAGFRLEAWNGKLPMRFESEKNPEKTLKGYFCSKGLFCGGASGFGGMYAVWFDSCVSMDKIREFLSAHPAKSLGTFAEAPAAVAEDPAAFRPCYLFAAREHANADLSRWLSDDRHAAQWGLEL